MRLLRTLAGYLWAAACRALRGMADAAHLRRIAGLQDELAEARHRVASLESKAAILEAEVEELALWRQRIIETHKAEAQAQVARRVSADVVGRGEE